MGIRREVHLPTDNGHVDGADVITGRACRIGLTGPGGKIPAVEVGRGVAVKVGRGVLVSVGAMVGDGLLVAVFVAMGVADGVWLVSDDED